MIQYLISVKEKLGNKLWYVLHSRSHIPARIYGSPKLDEVGVPLKPLVDNIGFPTHELAKYIFLSLIHI